MNPRLNLERRISLNEKKQSIKEEAKRIISKEEEKELLWAKSTTRGRRHKSTIKKIGFEVVLV